MTTTSFAELFNAAREHIQERVAVVRKNEHSFYEPGDLESVLAEQALIEQQIFQVEAMGARHPA